MEALATIIIILIPVLFGVAAYFGICAINQIQFDEPQEFILNDENL